jgi:hypothetical protein
VYDSSGKAQTIGFDYATGVNIWVNIAITKNAAYPSDGDAQVKLAVIKYIGGTDAANNVYTGLSMGASVILNELVYRIKNSVAGVTDLTIQFSTNGSTFSASNVAINTTQVAQTDSTKVTVTSA